MKKAICVANQKGGVGKSTTAVNLSAWLAVAEKRTLLLDIDPQGNTTGGLGVNKEELERHVYDVLIGESSLKDVLLSTELPFLKIAPAKNDLIGAEVELVSMLSRENKLKSAMEGVLEEFYFIIIDCPPSLGLLTVNALNAATSVLIPVQCEYFALEGMGQLLSTINLIKEHLNPSLEIEGILLTMFDSRNNLSHQVAQEVRDHFQDKVFRAVIPRNVKLSECPSHGKPIMLYDIQSKGSSSYWDLTMEILHRSYPEEWSQDGERSLREEGASYMEEIPIMVMKNGGKAH